MLQVFGMASSNAAIIVNMDACENKLGISKKIYSLSIPLGATVNMDGTCIYLVIFGMALARVFGVDINGGMMLSMVFLRVCSFCRCARSSRSGACMPVCTSDTVECSACRNRTGHGTGLPAWNDACNEQQPGRCDSIPNCCKIRKEA